MSESTLDKEYLKVLKRRHDYFKSKPITELTAEEIQEYQNLCKEVTESLFDIKNVVRNAWEQIKEMPEIQAKMKYQERVINRSESNGNP